jgi:hypothetical protein
MAAFATLQIAWNIVGRRFHFQKHCATVPAR